MNVYEKHAAIVQELKAPKSKRNNFAGFDYRNVSGIIEQVKPLLAKYKCTVYMNDVIKQVGDRFYIEVYARLQDIEDVKGMIEVTAIAREQATKKGMDEAQITGATSSYARKYALCGLFLIDDSELEPTHDIDAESGRTEAPARQAPKQEAEKPKKNQKAVEAWKAFKALPSVQSMSTDARDAFWKAELKSAVGHDNSRTFTDADWDKVINAISIAAAM